MTAAVFLHRRYGAFNTAANRVVYEVPYAVRAGFRHVASLTGLSIWQRVVIVFLKFVAVIGYLFGKWRSQGALGEATQRRTGTQALVAHAVSRCMAASVPKQRMHTLGGRQLIAVIVPVFSKDHIDQSRLLRTLDAVSQQTRQPDYLILIDDKSPLRIPGIISGARVRVVSLDSNCGPATARNAGLAVARKLGVHIAAFLDADCMPAPSWLGYMERAQQRQPGIIAGRTMATQPESYIGLYHDVCGTLNGRQLAPGPLLYGCTCNLSVNLQCCKQDFDDNFPQAAFEDVEYCVRATKNNVELSYDRDAVVCHHYVNTVAGLFWQFARYGQHEPTMCRIHPEYLTLLYASKEISSLSAVGFKLATVEAVPPADQVLLKQASNSEREDYTANGSLFAHSCDG